MYDFCTNCWAQRMWWTGSIHRKKREREREREREKRERESLEKEKVCPAICDDVGKPRKESSMFLFFRLADECCRLETCSASLRISFHFLGYFGECQATCVWSNFCPKVNLLLECWSDFFYGKKVSRQRPRSAMPWKVVSFECPYQHPPWSPMSIGKPAPKFH